MTNDRPSRNNPARRAGAFAAVALVLQALGLGMLQPLGTSDAQANAAASPTICAAADCVYLPVVARGVQPTATIDGGGEETPAATPEPTATATAVSTGESSATPAASASATTAATPTAVVTSIATTTRTPTATVVTPATATATLAPADVQIVQLRIRPGSGQNVQIRNAGGQVAVMTGWTLSDDDAPPNVYTFGPFALFGGTSVRVWNGDGTDTTTDLYWNLGSAAIWNDAGDTARLRNAQGTVVSQCTYEGPIDVVYCQ